MHHTDLALKAVIEACDRAISQEDYDTLMAYYAEDAALVVKPGMVVRGKKYPQSLYRHCRLFPAPTGGDSGENGGY
ncbi:Yybh protein [Klebsiella aerogenes]|nr:Yybh protein [Klebsiella aerogenes]